MSHPGIRHPPEPRIKSGVRARISYIRDPGNPSANSALGPGY
jgi:hypothetical protein